MMEKKIHGTKVWVLIAQIPNGRWVGFFCYRIGNNVHHSYLLEWSGGVSSHVRYHLLRQGIKPNGINNLIRGSFDFQATKEAAEAVMGNDGSIRTKSQVAAEQVLQNHENTQHWVDLTLGMMQCQKEEYERQQAAQAKTAGSDWKYNFDEKHLVNPVAGRADDGMAFTLTRNISLGDTDYDVVAVDDNKLDLDDILNDPYDDEEDGDNRMDIQMDQVHQDMGCQCTHTASSLSGEEGGSASKESTRRTSSKESLTSGNSSRGREPGQDVLASDLAKSSL
jgi:hypothetical protein